VKALLLRTASGRAIIGHHAQNGGFPATKIAGIAMIIDPTTGHAASTQLCGVSTDFHQGVQKAA
jgi:hypothetical protein